MFFNINNKIKRSLHFRPDRHYGEEAALEIYPARMLCMIPDTWYNRAVRVLELRGTIIIRTH